MLISNLSLKKKIFIFCFFFLILSIGLLFLNNRPYYIYLSDIEPAYYMSAYLIMNSELPVFYFHPATLFQYISGSFLSILNLNNLNQINLSLNYLKLLAIIFNLISIIFFLKISNRYKLKNDYKILICCIFYPATLLYVTYFGVNSIVLGLSLILSSIYIKNHFNNFNSLISLSIISGICLNSKLIFLPCLIIIFINIFFNGNKFLNYKNFKKVIIYTVFTALTFFLVGFKMMHTYPEILIKLFNRPEGNLGIYNYIIVLFLALLITFFYSKNENILNNKIKIFFLFFFIIYFIFIIFKYWSIDQLPTFFRYQAAFYIFALILINLKFNLTSKFYNIFIPIILILFSVTHYSAYTNTENQKNISLSYKDFLQKKISNNYYIYFWTGSGNDSYDAQNFIQWADLRYGNSYIKKNDILNFANKQIYNIRLDINNYDISRNFKEKNNLKKRIKKVLIKYKIFPKVKFKKNYYNINTNISGKCLLIIFTKFEFDIEINKLKSNELFVNKPILFLEKMSSKKLNMSKVYLGDREFIYFTEKNKKCN